MQNRTISQPVAFDPIAALDNPGANDPYAINSSIIGDPYAAPQYQDPTKDMLTPEPPMQNVYKS